MTINTNLLRLTDCTIPTEWLDYNGHMNDATYAIAFTHAVDAFMRHIGMDSNYRSTHKQTIFTLESHTRFLREVFVGEHLSTDLQLMDHDEKRAHVFMRLIDQSDVTRATSEQMLMVIDTNTRRAGRFCGLPADSLNALRVQQETLPIPATFTRKMGIPKN